MGRCPARTAALWMLVLAMLLTGCGSAAEEASTATDVAYEGLAGTVLEGTQADDHVFSINYDPDASINPFYTDSNTNMQFCGLLYEPLFVVDTDFSYSSDLIAGYETQDYQWWTLTVNTAIRFTDGTFLTAQDVAYSLQRAQQSSFFKGRMSTLYGVSTIDNERLAISAKTPHSTLPVLLNIPVVKYGTGTDDIPIGTGPYVFSEAGSRLERSSYYRYAADLPVAEIWLKSYDDAAERISAFDTSLLDIAVNDPTGMYSFGYGGSNEIRSFDTTNMHYIGFNMQSPLFQSVMARYALGFAVDREDVVNSYMNGYGIPVTLPVHPDSGLYEEEYAAGFAFDLAKCEQYFQAAGVDDLDDDGVYEILYSGFVVDMNINFIVNNDNSVKLQAARRIAENLNSLGYKTTLRELTWTDYMYCLNSGDFDMYYGEIRMTPDWNAGVLFDSDTGLNYGKCRDSGFKQRYNAYLKAVGDEKDAAFQEAIHYVAENAGIIPICFERMQLITHRGVVSGASPTQYDIFHNFHKWTITLT